MPVPEGKREESLKRLFDRTREAIESDRNRENRKKWNSPRGAFHAFLGASYFSRALHVDMREYYFDPALYLETNLRVNLLEFEKFRDDVALEYNIPWHPGVVMEPLLLGMQAKYQPDKEPWEDHDPLLKEPEDLKKLEPPDFYKSEAMRYIHRMYEELSELVQKLAPDFHVSFPSWKRSPFGNACSLRGMEKICMDFYDRPEFVCRLMEFVTEARIQWASERAKFLGQHETLILANDEVNVPTLSPSQYEEYVLPYERRLLSYYGELEYYHSCGNLTPMLEQIKTLRPRMLHVSPWTDLEKACELFSEEHTVLDVWVHVAGDVMYATEEQALQAVKRRVEICEKHRVEGYQFNSGNLQALGVTTEEDDEKILQWVRACRAAESGCNTQKHRSKAGG